MGFNVTDTYTINEFGLDLTNAYVTFHDASGGTERHEYTQPIEFTQGGSLTKGTHVVPLCAADHLVNGSHWTLTDGNGAVFVIWYNVDNGFSAPAVAGTALEVNVSATDSAKVVAAATNSALNGALFTASNYMAPGNYQSAIQITNRTIGSSSAVVDASGMPSYTRYLVNATYRVYVNVNQKRKKPLESGTVQLSSPVSLNDSNTLTLLYDHIKAHQFAGHTTEYQD